MGNCATKAGEQASSPKKVSKGKNKKGAPEEASNVENNEKKPLTGGQSESKDGNTQDQSAAVVGTPAEDGVVPVDSDDDDDDASESMDESDCDSSDEFELNMRVLNPRNLDNPEEMGEAFGIDLMSKEQMDGNDLFAMEETGAGECFMSVKPWLGSIVEPDEAPENNPGAPDETLILEHVYGYSGHIRNAVYSNAEGKLVYPAASLTITTEVAANTQTYSRGQNDDVTCICQHPSNPNVFATGQVATIVKRRGTQPHVCVFDSSTGEILARLDSAAQRAVRCVAFSPCGKFLAVIGDDNDYHLNIFEWETGTRVCSQKTGNSKIYACKWNPHVENQLVTVGKKHVSFWEFDAGTGSCKSSRGRFGTKFARQSFYCVDFSEKGYALCGAHAGHVYVFVNKVCKAAKKIHGGAVLAIKTRGNLILTGGSDSCCRVLDNRMAIISETKFDKKVRSIFISDSESEESGESLNAWIGTANCIYKSVLPIQKGSEENADDEETETKTGEIGECIVKSHYNGELWAIGWNPNQNQFASAGEDNTVMIYDADSRTCVKSGIVNEVKGKIYRRRKAGTTSTEAPNRCVRALAWSPDGNKIAMGLNSGELAVIEMDDEKESEGTLNVSLRFNLNEHSKRKVIAQHGNWIEAMSFSPDGSILAVGTHGLSLILCDVNDNFAVKKVLKTHNSAITHIDWSTEGDHIQSTCNAYELLFHDINREDLKESSHNPSPSSLTGVSWQTHSCQFGWPVQGVFDSSMDGTDVNVCAQNTDKTLIATGDDFSKVNLYRYPCADPGNEKRSFSGHSSHVRTVLFSPNGEWLISAGGNDKCVFQWKVAPAASEEE